MSFSTSTYRRKIIIGMGLLVTSITLFTLLSPNFSPEYLDMHRATFFSYYQQRPIQVLIGFVLLTSLMIGLALPVAGITLILAGALFNFPLGAIAGGAACTLGATFSFLWSRYLFRDLLYNRYNVQLGVVNRGVEREGWFYVFGLRLLMLFPFFMVNMLCALTSMRLSIFVSATLCSQLIVASLWTYFGSRLARIEQGSDLLSPESILALALVGFAPLAFRRLFSLLHRQQV